MTGIDLAKGGFQVHGALMAGHVKFRKKLSRGQSGSSLSSRQHL